MQSLKLSLIAGRYIMWLSEPTEIFPLTHAYELCLILGQYNVITTGRIKVLYVEI